MKLPRPEKLKLDLILTDGKKLTEDNHNINVFAKYGGSGYVQVGRFTVSHIAD